MKVTIDFGGGQLEGTHSFEAPFPMGSRATSVEIQAYGFYMATNGCQLGSTSVLTDNYFVVSKDQIGDELFVRAESLVMLKNYQPRKGMLAEYVPGQLIDALIANHDFTGVVCWVLGRPGSTHVFLRTAMTDTDAKLLVERILSKRSR